MKLLGETPLLQAQSICLLQCQSTAKEIISEMKMRIKL